MRVLVLTPTFLPAVGGAELLLLHVYRRLALRHDVLFVTPQLSEKVLRSIGSDEYDSLVNFDVRRFADRVSMMRIRGHRLTGGLIPPFSFSAVAAVSRGVRVFKPDVLNVHYCMPTGLAGVYADVIQNVPCVLSLTGRDVPSRSTPHFWRMWHRLVGRAVHETTFITEWCRRAVWGEMPRGVVLPGGVDVPDPLPEREKSATRERLGVPDGGRLLFALQRFDKVKRVDVLLHAMPAILAGAPETVLAIGGKGEAFRACQRVAESLGVQHAVRFLGFVPEEDVFPLMQAADVFLFHSTFETFGIVVAQAMVCATPVVAVNDPAVAEVVGQDGAGVLVQPLNHDAMARAVVDLLKDDERRELMGQRGRARALAEYTWDAVAGGYEAVLARAARRNS